ncbi:tRNA pseudouridine synthase A [Balamuthia mandrillaris]
MNGCRLVQHQRFKLSFEYCGTPFIGFAKNAAIKTKPSICNVLEAALWRLTGQTVKVVGSSRTDSGVHALCNVAHIDMPPRLSPAERKAVFLRWQQDPSSALLSSAPLSSPLASSLSSSPPPPPPLSSPSPSPASSSEEQMYYEAKVIMSAMNQYLKGEELPVAVIGVEPMCHVWLSPEEERQLEWWKRLRKQRENKQQRKKGEAKEAAATTSRSGEEREEKEEMKRGDEEDGGEEGEEEEGKEEPTFQNTTERCRGEWHARFSAVGRTYVYRLLSNCGRRPASSFEKDRMWHIKERVDFSALQRACAVLQGEHDFSSFRSKNCYSKSPIRNLSKFSVERIQLPYTCIYRDVSEEAFQFTAHSSSFLQHQVRLMMEAVVEVGTGKLQLEALSKMLAAKDRRHGPNHLAPPHGLYLKQVHYPPFSPSLN